jgi:uncharacterized protein YndB with AHSA1/START domain
VLGLNLSISIAAPPTRVMCAFFDADALAAWWNGAGLLRRRRLLAAARRQPIGPMALEVTCKPINSSTDVRIVQKGYEEGARRRDSEVVTAGWQHALKSMKMLLEK